MQNSDEASPSNILVGRALLVKMLKNLDRMVYFVQILYIFVLYHCPAAGMQNGDEASPSIILARQALLVKMLITLEPHGVFGSSFVYYCILTLTSRWFVQR